MCKVGVGVMLLLEGMGNEGNLMEFIYVMEGVIMGNVRGRLCINFIYLMNLMINVLFLFNNIVLFYVFG